MAKAFEFIASAEIAAEFMALALLSCDAMFCAAIAAAESALELLASAEKAAWFWAIALIAAAFADRFEARFWNALAFAASAEKAAALLAASDAIAFESLASAANAFGLADIAGLLPLRAAFLNAEKFAEY